MAAPGYRMSSGMELVQPLDASGDESPFAVARLHRQLTVAETARRAGLSEEEARWLEEGRVYRFPSPDDALLAALLYGTALGIDNREARELAGRPVPATPVERNPIPRLIAAGAILIGIALFAAFLVIPRGGGGKNPAQAGGGLPPPGRGNVDVLNGSGGLNYTRQIAGHVQA